MIDPRKKYLTWQQEITVFQTPSIKFFKLFVHVIPNADNIFIMLCVCDILWEKAEDSFFLFIN